MYCNLQIVCSALTSELAPLFPDLSQNVDTRTRNFVRVSVPLKHFQIPTCAPFHKAPYLHTMPRGCMAKILYYTKYLSFTLNHCFTMPNLWQWNMTHRLPPYHLLFFFSPLNFYIISFTERADYSADTASTFPTAFVSSANFATKFHCLNHSEYRYSWPKLSYETPL